MIIKEKSIKSYANLERVLRYILHKNEEETFVYKRFIKGDRRLEKKLQEVDNTEATSILQEQRLQNMKLKFVANDKQRLHKRKGETKFYHCILSFHKADRLTQEQLLLVAKHYAKTRFPKSIVVATNHTDTEHQHVHLVGSNVEYGLHTTRYLTKTQFREVKLEMEVWQERTLGSLEHSKVDHSKKKAKSLHVDAEHQINLRGKRSEKQTIMLVLAEAYSKAKSQEAFYTLIKEAGLDLYFRGTRPGIKGKRNYRLQTLGYSQERLQSLDLQQNRRQQELQNIVDKRIQQNRDTELNR